ncbi:MAG TPA: hypothetical protein VFC09_11465 [Candidatus Dormibacteraeota bacterium]|nr:hypothetical protein [Candidatus Dormibacteraeota bacterium]
MSVLVCDGCGRVAGEREVSCGACGRMLPGRSEDDSAAAPPGWLVAPTARDQAGPWFEPMPAVPLPVPERPLRAAPPPRSQPTYRVAEERRQPGEARPVPAPPPPTLPVPGAEPPVVAGGAAAALSERAPALRALLVPLLLCAVGSSLGAVLLLVLHLLRDR